MTGCFRQYAGQYYDAGLSLTPCNGKKPIGSWKGCQSAQVAPDIFKEWKQKHPSANIGLITGAVNNLCVIDCDDPYIFLNDLEDKFGTTPVAVLTPRGGKHLYYAFNGEGSGTKIFENINIRGSGGLIIAPPSFNYQIGRPYQFIKGNVSELLSLPLMKISVHDITTKTASQKQRPKKKNGKIVKGERNNALFMRVKDAAFEIEEFDVLVNFAQQYNQEHCIPPLPKTEAVKIAKSVWDYKEKGELWNKGSSFYKLPETEFDSLCAYPNALALYMFIRKNNLGFRTEFAITHDAVAKRLGWKDGRKVKRAIEVLLEYKKLERVRNGGRGSHDPHLYKLLGCKNGI